jgi:hypothetical protein
VELEALLVLELHEEVELDAELKESELLLSPHEARIKRVSKMDDCHENFIECLPTNDYEKNENKINTKIPVMKRVKNHPTKRFSLPSPNQIGLLETGGIDCFFAMKLL